MKKNLLILALAVCGFSMNNALAQSLTNENVIDDNYISSKLVTIEAPSNKYVGSPYTNAAFQTGSVFKNGKAVASNVKLRYNAKKDEIELKKDMSASGGFANVIKASKDIHVRILNKVYVYFPKKDAESAGGYFQVMQEGDKINYYKKEMKKFIEGKKSINTITRDIPPTYKDKEAFFVLLIDGELMELPSSRNKRLALFASNKKEVKQYVKEKRININKPFEFLKVVKYYNTL